MEIVDRVQRHPWPVSVLMVAAACGGSTRTVSHPSEAYAPPGAGDAASSAPGQAASTAQPSHAAVETSGPVAEVTPERPGLGTSWGEQVNAPISFSPFVRASSSPWAEVALHYNDAEGVAAHAAHLGSRPEPLQVFAGDGALSVSLTDAAGRTLPGFHARGRALIVGEDGERYKIVIRNTTPARFEVVASVDGLDVIDGKPAGPERRGYLVKPYDVLVIDGFRTSDLSVAAFRFGRVADSYAARTSGDRNVGVIGIAMFGERGAVWTPGELQRRDTANPFPNRGYATAPSW